MNVVKLSVLVILLVVAIIGYRVFRSAPQSTDASVDSGEQLESAPTAGSADSIAEMFDQPTARSSVTEEPTCLTLVELNAHPLIRKLRNQAEAASTNGADVEKFRGVDDASVRDFADQGDSAAMAVVGAMSVMRAYRMDVSRAVDWLANDGELDGVIMQRQPMSSDASLALNDAAYWFYQAALHGRIFALKHYGQVRGQLFGGAVGLGWIEQQEYDALEPDQKQELSPAIMYSNLALEMKPQPDAGVVPTSLRLASGAEAATQIRSDIHNEFSMAVVDAGLPPSATSAGDIAEFEKLRSQVCATELLQR